RRRHTRFSRDWSSDVCSSDLNGATLTVNGSVIAPEIRLQGGGQADEILIDPDGGSTLDGHIIVKGGAGDDTITVHEMHSLDLDHKYRDGVTGPDRLVTGRAPGERNTIDLDGEGGADQYIVNVTGASDYIINARDSGAPDDGADWLTINGTPGDDAFLLRKDFVAVMQAEGEGFGEHYERINYDTSINGRLQINALDGDDRFWADDN